MDRLLSDERCKAHCVDLQERELEYSALYSPPPADSSTAIPTCHSDTDLLLQKELLHARDEPLLVPGVSLGRADERWGSVEALVHHYGHVIFDIVSGNCGVPLVEFLQYAQNTRAAFPLYLVEAQFVGERAPLLQDFVTPEPFRDDVRSLVLGNGRKNPHWFLGGPRSGTFLHVDPRSTSGWNVGVLGAKRWLFLPPNTDLEKAGLPPLHAATEEGGVASWFLDNAPRLRQLHAQGELPGLYEAVQRPGDLIFIPCGWMHAVLNLELSCALGQTLIHACSLPRLWPTLKRSHPDFAAALRLKLQLERPALEAELPSTPPSDEHLVQVGWRAARAAAVAQAMSTVPLACAVVAQDGEYGGGVFTSRECIEGEALLSIPLSACITSNDIPTDHKVLSRFGSDESDKFGRGVVSLLLALEADAESIGSEGISCAGDNEEHCSSTFSSAAYMRAVAPPFMLRWLAMAGWKQDSIPAGVVRGSVAWARAKAHQEAMQTEASLLGAAGVKSCQGVAAYATYQYAQLLLQTRSFKLPSGPVLCPLIDLTNHLSAGCNAKTKLEGGSGEGGEPCLVLRATRRLYAGEEVFQNYDGDADYSDIFERYGFLDKTANIHTAEVYVPSGSFVVPGDSQAVAALRASVIGEAQEAGCDAAQQAWWVTDFHLLRCPLVAAARISAVSADTLEAMLKYPKEGTSETTGNFDKPDKNWFIFQSPLTDPRDEAAARLKVSQLVEAQVQRLAKRDSSWEEGIRGETLTSVQEEEECEVSNHENVDSVTTTSTDNDSYNEDESECAASALELACRFAEYEASMLKGVVAELCKT